MSSSKKRIIFLVDCQSFYASVEKAAHPEYEYKPLVVAGNPEERRGIILAACPIAKKYGVTTAETVKESLIKCPDLVIMKPRMQAYLDVSAQITEILETYTDLVEPYSVDEQFCDVTGSVRLFGGDPLRIAQSMQIRIKEETGVYTRVGISENKVLAKMACDNKAKKNDTGIFHMSREQLPKELWELPLNKMFMVGSRMMAHLNKLNLFTIGQLAQTPLPDLKRLMRRRMGRQSDIHAEVLWRIANGMDDAPVDPFTHGAVQKAIGHQMTLPYDFRTMEELKVVLLELSELVCRRCRSKGLMGWVVSVGCQGANFDFPTGFYRQSKLPDPTHITKHVYEASQKLFRTHWDGAPVRKVAITLSTLVSSEEYQLTMFEDREKLSAVERVTDTIKSRFGEMAITRAASVTEAGQMNRRSNMIGGHWK
jgi:DNA polymerase-4